MHECASINSPYTVQWPFHTYLGLNTYEDQMIDKHMRDRTMTRMMSYHAMTLINDAEMYFRMTVRIILINWLSRVGYRYCMQSAAL